MNRAASVDAYIEHETIWQDELVRLRKLLVASGMEETVKWGAPCYTINGKNVVGLAAFKGYVGLWFHQGALISDPDGCFVSAEGTKALRQWRFATGKAIKPARIKAYLKEAIALAKAGKAVPVARNKPLAVPPKLAEALAADKAAAAAWAAFGIGKQREYADHINSAKRDATKASRLEKIMPMIASGLGLNDKYRK